MATWLIGVLRGRAVLGSRICACYTTVGRWIVELRGGGGARVGALRAVHLVRVGES